MFLVFFSVLLQDRSTYLSFRFLSIVLWSVEKENSTIRHLVFYCLLSIGLVVWRRFDHLFISQNPRVFCLSFSRTDSGLYIYHLFAWSNLTFLHNSQWITFPIQSYLVLHSLCANFLHLLIMGFIVSSLSPHNLHLLFCCDLSILALT